MHYIDKSKMAQWVSWAGVVTLAGCASSPMPPHTPSAPAPAPAPVVIAPPVAPAPAPAPVPLARSWDDYRVQAARRIAQVNAQQLFSGPLPDVLQSIPVLTIHLHPDGTIRDIETMRVPRFAPETIQMAMKAIRQAAPFGPVSHLPQPWQFNETFLYNDDLKFQIRSLVESR